MWGERKLFGERVREVEGRGIYFFICLFKKYFFVINLCLLSPETIRKKK